MYFPSASLSLRSSFIGTPITRASPSTIRQYPIGWQGVRFRGSALLCGGCQANVHPRRQPMGYQLVAKIHEVAIQASLATVVFSYIRHEMTIGNGIPIGTLFSGLQINHIACLWSMEFWGSLRSPHLPLGRKIALLFLVFVSIVLASLSGPSSIILLIPRYRYMD